MRQRYRYKLRWLSSGSTTVIPTGNVQRYRYVEDERYMYDFVEKAKRKPLGLLPNSDVDSDKIERIPPTISGENGYWRHKLAPMVPSYYPVTDHYLPRYARQTENAFYATRLVANTHPFRSEFSVPTAIAEMLDIGTLFKLTAKTFAELAGNSYLQYKFGYLQFVQDIQTLASITTAIERRVKEFSSLSLHGGLRRKMDLDANSWSSQGPTGIIWSTYGVYVDGNFTNNQTQKVWGTIRWKWKDGIQVSLSKLEAWNLAVKTVFDLGELDASTIWNSLPWTWLADYMVDIGSWLQATENQDLVEPFDICIVREFKSLTNIYPTLINPGDPYRVKKGRFIRTINTRDVIANVPALPPIRYSFLSKAQVLVIAALYGKFRGGSY